MSSHPGASQAASAAQREWQKSREKFSTSPGPPKCAVPGIRERFVCRRACDSRPFEKKKQNPLRRVRPCVVRARVCVPLCFHALLVIPSPSDNSSELSVRALFIVFFLLSSGTACRTLSVHSSFRPHHNFLTTSLPPPLLLPAPCYGPTTSSPHKRRHFLSLTRQTFNLSGPSRMRTEPKRYRRCARTWIHWRSAWQRFHALWTLREMKEQSFCARSPVYRLGW